MPKFNRVVIAVAMLISICVAIPSLAATNTISPDSGVWTVEINAPGASVSISGLEQPYSTVQVTVLYTGLYGLSSESQFPVNVMYLRTASISPQKEGSQIKQITFECTRGKVEIDVQPTGGSGGGSGVW